MSKKINSIIGLLLNEGAKASGITRIITEINDRLVKKILELAEERLGDPPVPYCWFVFGSEGRKEQTFKTDQDNALSSMEPCRWRVHSSKYWILQDYRLHSRRGKWSKIKHSN